MLDLRDIPKAFDKIKPIDEIKLKQYKEKLQPFKNNIISVQEIIEANVLFNINLYSMILFYLKSNSSTCFKKHLKYINLGIMLV